MFSQESVCPGVGSGQRGLDVGSGWVGVWSAWVSGQRGVMVSGQRGDGCLVRGDGCLIREGGSLVRGGGCLVRVVVSGERGV